MSFDVKSGKVNINIKTFNNVSNNTKNIFSNDIYKDVPKFNFERFNTSSDKRFDFSVSSKNLAFKLYEAKAKKIKEKDAFSFASLIDGIVDLGKTVGASVVNTVVGITEGLTTFAESIVDCGALLVGGVATIGTAIWDTGVGLFTGDWSYSTTGVMWKDGIMPLVGTDYTDKAFDSLYNTSVMKAVDNSAHDWFKRETGVAYAIAEGVGYYTGMILATTLTCGAMGVASGGAAVASTATKVATISAKTIVQAGYVAAGSMGKNTQKGYNEAVANAEGRELSMGDIGRVLGHSASKAVVDGGIMLAAGALGDSISSASDVVKAADAAGTNVSLSTNILGNIGGGTKQFLTTGIKASKAYITEGVDCLFTGEEYSFKDASIDAVATVAAEYLAYGVGKGFAKAGVFTNSDHSKSWNVPKIKFVEYTGKLSGATDMVAKSLKPVKNFFVNTGRVVINSFETAGIKGFEKMYKEVGTKVVKAAGDALFKGE